MDMPPGFITADAQGRVAVLASAIECVHTEARSTYTPTTDWTTSYKVIVTTKGGRVEVFWTESEAAAKKHMDSVLAKVSSQKLSETGSGTARETDHR